MKQKYLVILNLILFGARAAFPQISLNPSASREIGQPILSPVKTGNPNWIDGREFFEPQGIVLDTSASPPIIYVADTLNNRVMAWKNATGFSNGQPADLIIGQPDQYTTSPAGPSVANTAFTTGLTSPVGLAVLNGDLFVADTGNNRILRFRKPFSQTNGNVFPDLWLGQPALTSATANYTGGLSAQGLSLAGFQSYLAFDSSSNLWVSDAANNRVLRFPAATFSCSSCGGGAADTVIGQPNLTSANTTPLNTSTSSSGVIGNQFDVPAALAFDAAGRLYVSDGGVSGYPGRVLVYSPPFQPGGMNASGIMGVFAPTVATAPTQAQIDSTVMASPSGIFFFQDQSVGVIDSGFNRIMIFPPYTLWPNQATTFSPQATAVFGQINFTSFQRNGAQSTTSVTPVPANNVLADPTAAFFLQATNQLFLADSGNNRAIVLPVTADTLGSATTVLGQDSFNQGSINLIEGREFQFVEYSGSSEILDAGIAIDNSGGTPHLYISDPNNHRVLGFKDIRNLQSSAKADIVIGQPSLGSALCNYPSGDSALPTNTSLCYPKGILVDSQGNLFVADSFNGRVLRFPAPFSQPFGQVTADLVLGQAGFGSSIKVPSSSTMGSPYGLALTGTNGLMVSDSAYNRVLYIPFSSNATFAAGTDNGKIATKVFGQASFQTVTAGSTDATLSSPHHIACDTNGQLYVADSGNNRIVIFGDPNSQQTAAAAQPSVLSINNLASPEGVYVNPTTGEIWVANTRNGTAVRYPKFETLLFNQMPIDANPIQAPYVTLAVAQDQFGDLVLADGDNRVAFYYPGIYGLNGASFETDKNVAPGMIATIKPLPSTGTTIAGAFGGTTAANTASAWPTTLGGVQVLFNGTAAPLDYVSPTQINFQVPNGAPTTGTVTAQVVQTSTGQIYGAGLLPMDSVSPGVFICGASTGTLRQACALNQDFSVNGGTNAAPRGSVIQIFATGEGAVPSAPPDGTPATAATSSPAALRVFMGFDYVDEIPLQPGESNGGNFIKYSGLAPGLVGVWQINVQIPEAVGVGNQVAIAVVLNGNVADPDLYSGYQATIAVK
jgi:uncharacterized protein (TIGR03437 family)